jgi:hypothetical protein
VQQWHINSWRQMPVTFPFKLFDEKKRDCRELPLSQSNCIHMFDGTMTNTELPNI